MKSTDRERKEITRSLVEAANDIVNEDKAPIDEISNDYWVDMYREDIHKADTGLVRFEKISGVKRPRKVSDAFALIYKHVDEIWSKSH
jgi:single-stranded DNA-specific DHH superfamily exonuclease